MKNSSAKVGEFFNVKIKKMKTTDNQQEMFIVVDENDMVLGYKTRYECHHDKTLIHRSAGLVIFNDRGEILLQKRSLTKDTYPGFYTLSASGHVNKGETPAEAITREAIEEIGAHIQPEFKMKFLYEDPRETEIDYLFTTQHDGPFLPNPLEVEEVAFFSLEEVKQMKDVLTPGALFSLEKLSLL